MKRCRNGFKFGTVLLIKVINDIRYINFSNWYVLWYDICTIITGKSDLMDHKDSLQGGNYECKKSVR